MWDNKEYQKLMKRLKEKTPYDEFAEKAMDWSKSIGYFTSFLVTVKFPSTQSAPGLPGHEEYYETEYLEYDGDAHKFIWLNDWWEGQEGVELCGFLPLDGIRIFGMGPGPDTTIEYKEER